MPIKQTELTEQLVIAGQCFDNKMAITFFADPDGGFVFAKGADAHIAAGRQQLMNDPVEPFDQFDAEGVEGDED